MNPTIDALYYTFVFKPHADDFPQETAELSAKLEKYSWDARNLADMLAGSSSLTAYREGLRLGLALSQACPPPDPLP